MPHRFSFTATKTPRCARPKGRAMQKYKPPSERLSVTPLVDIAFLVLIFFMSLPLKTLDGKLSAYLPTEKGIVPIEQKQPRDVIHLFVYEDSFRLGDRRVADLEALRPILIGLGPDNTYSVRATGAIPWARIVKAVDTLQSLHYKHIEFYGTADPSRSTRRAVPMPTPAD